jgi:hypothetical protein
MIDKLNNILGGLLASLGQTLGYILVIGIIGFVMFRLMRAVPLIGFALAVAALVYLTQATTDPMMLLNDLKAMGGG